MGVWGWWWYGVGGKRWRSDIVWVIERELEQQLFVGVVTGECGKNIWCWMSIIKLCSLFNPIVKNDFPMMGNNSPSKY